MGGTGKYILWWAISLFLTPVLAGLVIKWGIFVFNTLNIKLFF
jgi:hypothetical protein